MARRRPRFRPRRKARFFLIQTVALWVCLMLVTLTCTGFTQGEVVARRALEHLGKPYVLGAAGPDQFDCSGLVYWSFSQIGITLQASAYTQGYDEGYERAQNQGGTAYRRINKHILVVAYFSYISL